ncbi:MAG: FAD-dependent oxidoreductase, partial [Gammaproteobacteria bacterium]
MNKLRLRTSSATRHKDLRTGVSVWEAIRRPPVPVGRLRRDQSTDVLVVGAGISGALISEALVARGLEVVIVDRRGPVLGSTPASTALLQYELDTPLSLLIGRLGRTNAERVWRRSRLALDALRERSRHLGIEAEQINRDSLYLSGTVLDTAGLHREAEARRRAGFECTYLTRNDVRDRYGIKGRSALLSYDNLAADPRRLATGFLNAAIRGGARLLAPVDVTGIEASRQRVLATTRDGPVITCHSLVFATGYEMPKAVPRAGHHVASTYAIATRPQPRSLWPTSCFIWEASDPYLYVRVTPDQRIICGGQDEDFSDESARDALLPAKTAALERRLGQLLPDVDPRAAFAWCGSFGTSPDGTP